MSGLEAETYSRVVEGLGGHRGRMGMPLGATLSPRTTL